MNELRVPSVSDGNSNLVDRSSAAIYASCLSSRSLPSEDVLRVAPDYTIISRIFKIDLPSWLYLFTAKFS